MRSASTLLSAITLALLLSHQSEAAPISVRRGAATELQKRGLFDTAKQVLEELKPHEDDIEHTSRGPDVEGMWNGLFAPPDLPHSSMSGMTHHGYPPSMPYGGFQHAQSYGGYHHDPGYPGYGSTGGLTGSSMAGYAGHPGHADMHSSHSMHGAYPGQTSSYFGGAPYGSIPRTAQPQTGYPMSRSARFDSSDGWTEASEYGRPGRGQHDPYGSYASEQPHLSGQGRDHYGASSSWYDGAGRHPSQSARFVPDRDVRQGYMPSSVAGRGHDGPMPRTPASARRLFSDKVTVKVHKPKDERPSRLGRLLGRITGKKAPDEIATFKSPDGESLILEERRYQ